MLIIKDVKNEAGFAPLFYLPSFQSLTPKEENQVCVNKFKAPFSSQA